jgi:hemerythrin-like domain-containing protein
MSTILDYLGSDHRVCDNLFAASEEAVSKRNWEGASKLFGQFHHAMERHFAMEEQVLFPGFEAKTSNSLGPTRVMRAEHEQMRLLMQEMESAVASHDGSIFLGMSETLNMLMQQHNLKEENTLYPMSDRALAAERETLLRDMDAIGN